MSQQSRASKAVSVPVRVGVAIWTVPARTTNSLLLTCGRASRTPACRSKNCILGSEVPLRLITFRASDGCSTTQRTSLPPEKMVMSPTATSRGWSSTYSLIGAGPRQTSCRCMSGRREKSAFAAISAMLTRQLSPAPRASGWVTPLPLAHGSVLRSAHRRTVEVIAAARLLGSQAQVWRDLLARNVAAAFSMRTIECGSASRRYEVRPRHDIIGELGDLGPRTTPLQFELRLGSRARCQAAHEPVGDRGNG